MEKLAYCTECKKILNYSVSITLPKHCPLCGNENLIPYTPEPITLTCKQCGKPLTIKSTGRKPLFCSLAHRVKYYRKTHNSTIQK
jgi:ribosomal protein S27E